MGRSRPARGLGRLRVAAAPAPDGGAPRRRRADRRRPLPATREDPMSPVDRRRRRRGAFAVGVSAGWSCSRRAPTAARARRRGDRAASCCPSPAGRSRGAPSTRPCAWRAPRTPRSCPPTWRASRATCPRRAAARASACRRCRCSRRSSSAPARRASPSTRASAAGAPTATRCAAARRRARRPRHRLGHLERAQRPQRRRPRVAAREGARRGPDPAPRPRRPPQAHRRRRRRPLLRWTPVSSGLVVCRCVGAHGEGPVAGVGRPVRGVRRLPLTLRFAGRTRRAVSGRELPRTRVASRGGMEDIEGASWPCALAFTADADR